MVAFFVFTGCLIEATLEKKERFNSIKQHRGHKTFTYTLRTPSLLLGQKKKQCLAPSNEMKWQDIKARHTYFMVEKILW